MSADDPLAPLARPHDMLALLLHTTEEGVWFIDNELRTTDANPAMCRMLGVTREQLIGRTIYEFVDAENEAIFRDQVRRRDEGLPGSYEIALRRPDGTRVHCQNNPTPVFDAQGRKLGAVGLFSDISARKRAADELQRTHEVLQAQSRVLRSTFESLSQGVLSVDGEGCIEAWNARAVELLQLPPQLLHVGLKLRELVAWQLANGTFDVDEYQPGARPRADVQRFVEGDREAMSTGTYRRARPDGRIIQVEVHPMAGGSQVRTYTDVTESVLAERALMASESRFRSMADAAPAYIWQSRADGSAVWFNQSWLRSLGQTLEEALARDWRTRIHPDDYDRCHEIYRRSLASTQPFRAEFRVLTHDGSELWLLDHGVPLRDAEGRHDGYVCYGWDVTSRRAAERSLIAARDEAERANQAKSEFLSRMSHELRTPLNAVMGFAQLIDSDADRIDAFQLRERVQQIQLGASHLLQLINEVLDLARIESGALTVELQPLDLGAALDEALRLVGPMARERDVVLVRDGAAKAPPVRVDATRTRQVLLNLLGNAIKYNHRGGEVRASLRAEGGEVGVDVADTGPGLDESQQLRLFQAFERLDADRGTVEGTGIGLALSKALVDLMGGRIGLHSRLGEGSVFWVRWPAASRPRGRAPSAPPGAAPAAGQPVPEGSEVLVIEDNAVNQIVIESMLRHLAGLQVRLAADPHVGLAMAFERRPDLVLLDIQLPGMTGFEVLRALRAHGTTQAVPVLAVSANAMPQDVQRALDAGFDGYLTKPLDLQRLLATVADAINRSSSSAPRPPR
ncbi:MAG: PAS domain S-box protein [Rubrivivax sp.]|nr:PAS domain S-box protein [Rubrivivax sp.]